MNYDQNAQFTRQTVCNFRFFDENTLLALAADLSLSLTQPQLTLCRDHFLMHERRDPTVGELRFLDALATMWLSLPEAAIIDGITCEQDEQRRCFADLLHKADALPNTAHSLPALMDVTGQYLSRSGITPTHEHLCSGDAVSLAARCAGQAPSLTLDLGETAAMLAPAPAKRYPFARNLFLLFPTGNEPFSVQTARFFAAHRDLELFPVCTPLDEGLFPHLLRLGGLLLDTTSLAGYRPEIGPASLLPLGKETVLFLAPDRAMPRFFAERAPVLHCGMLNGSRWLQIRYGSELLLSISLDLLYALRQQRKLSPTVTKQEGKQITRGLTASKSTLLGGVMTTGSCKQALLSLIGEMAQKGGSLSRATASTVLELPQATLDDTVTRSLPLLLDYHRVSAELALPSCPSCRRIKDCLAEPRLSIFIAAEQGAARDASFAAAWQGAAASEDFAAMRELLYQ